MNKFLEKVWEYIKAMKLKSSLVILSGIFLGLSLGVGSLNVPIDKLLILYLIIGIGCSAGSQVLNHVFGEKIDKIEHPKRAIPSGKISKKGLFGFAIFLLIITLFSVFISKDIFVLALLGVILGILYSVPGFKFENKWYSSSILLSVGYILIPILSGFFIVRGFDLFVLDVALFFALIVLGISPLKDIPDVKGDKKHKKNTLPVKIGTKNTILFSCVFVIVVLFVYFFILDFYLIEEFLNYILTMAILLLPLSLYVFRNPKRKINFTLLEVYGFLSEVIFVLWWISW